MSANKKQASTSKTARVMNLLSKNEDVQQASASGEEAEITSATPENTPVAAASTPPILSAMAADAAASEQIKQALETALESAPEQAPAPLSPAETPTHAQENAAPQATDSQSPQTPDENAQQPPQASDTQSSDEHELKYLNVMQTLVEEKAEKYIRMFGICPCERCTLDVKALALSKLPSKYVVLPKGDFVPRITIYENQYNSAIVAQLVQACKTVMEHPHHRKY